jgi:hypothetical protein
VGQDENVEREGRRHERREKRDNGIPQLRFIKLFYFILLLLKSVMVRQVPQHTTTIITKIQIKHVFMKQTTMVLTIRYDYYIVT